MFLEFLLTYTCMYLCIRKAERQSSIRWLNYPNAHMPGLGETESKILEFHLGLPWKQSTSNFLKDMHLQEVEFKAEVGLNP